MLAYAAALAAAAGAAAAAATIKVEPAGPAHNLLSPDEVVGRVCQLIAHVVCGSAAARSVHAAARAAAEVTASMDEVSLVPAKPQDNPGHAGCRELTAAAAAATNVDQPAEHGGVAVAAATTPCTPGIAFPWAARLDCAGATGSTAAAAAAAGTPGILMPPLALNTPGSAAATPVTKSNALRQLDQAGGTGDAAAGAAAATTSGAADAANGEAAPAAARNVDWVLQTAPGWLQLLAAAFQQLQAQQISHQQQQWQQWLFAWDSMLQLIGAAAQLQQQQQQQQQQLLQGAAAAVVQVLQSIAIISFAGSSAVGSSSSSTTTTNECGSNHPMLLLLHAATSAALRSLPSHLWLVTIPGFMLVNDNATAVIDNSSNKAPLPVDLRWVSLELLPQMPPNGQPQPAQPEAGAAPELSSSSSSTTSVKWPLWQFLLALLLRMMALLPCDPDSSSSREPGSSAAKHVVAAAVAAALPPLDVLQLEDQLLASMANCCSAGGGGGEDMRRL
jgi:hypothetical protein